MKTEKSIHIIETAMVMFNQNGFHATPTSKIAKKARVSVGTLFNYFHTKEDLIEAIYVYILKHSKSTFLENLQESNNQHDTLQSMWRAIVLWGVTNPEEFRYLELFSHSPFKNHYYNDKSLQAYNKFRENILKAISPNTICMKYPEYSLTYIDKSIHGAIRFILDQEIEDVDHFINASFDLLWNGFAQK
jgi:AcrR family transcriptional regulator